MKKYFTQIYDHLQALGSWLRESLRRNGGGDFTPRRRYRLSLDRTSSLTRLTSFSGSKFAMIMFGIGVFILAGLIWLAAVVYTPLRNLLPKQFTVELRDRYTAMSARLDSVADLNYSYGNYVSNLRSILTDSIDTLSRKGDKSIADIQDIPIDSLLPPTDREKTFVRSFEDEERFNLSVLSPIAAEGMTFYAPLTAAGADIALSKGDLPYVTISTASPAGVSAIYRGTVVNRSYTSGKGFTVTIQHPNDFISVYSGLSEAFCVKGSKVVTGERIGLTNGKKYPFSFELWHNGSPLAPEEYISFD